MVRAALGVQGGDATARAVLQEDTHVAADVISLDSQVADDVGVREGLVQ